MISCSSFLNRKMKRSPLISKSFDDMKVSTRTFTASTNLTIDIEKISNYLPVREPLNLELRTAKHERLRTILLDIPLGEIISINYMGNIRGINMKPRKKTKRWFRNSFTVVINAGEKLLNFKVCRNGTFQITGALSFKHATQCIQCIWDKIKGTDYYTCTDSIVKALIIPAMRNLDFTLGININRELFDQYIIDTNPDYHCLLETSFGYTGLNVKKKITKPITDLKITKLEIPIIQHALPQPRSEPEADKPTISRWSVQWKETEDSKLKEWIAHGYQKDQYKSTTLDDFIERKTEHANNYAINAQYKAMERKEFSLEKLNQTWKGSLTSYQEYLDIIKPSDREAKIKHVRYNTFLVFHSGKIIQSGLSEDFMRDDFYHFCNIINDAYAAGKLEETLVNDDDDDEE